MALFKILKGLKAKLPSTKTDGQIYYTTDESKLYVDNGAERKIVNAGTAEKLETGRTITLNGSTIGSTSASFDGSKDISLPITYLYDNGFRFGYNTLANQAGFAQSLALDELRANRLALTAKQDATYEVSTDGGVTWSEPQNFTDQETLALFTNFDANVRIGLGPYPTTPPRTATPNDMLRITITARAIYCQMKKIFIRVSTLGGQNCIMYMEHQLDGSTEWLPAGRHQDHTKYEAGYYPIAGWSGWNEYSCYQSNFGGGSASNSNDQKLRFTFSISEASSQGYHSFLTIQGIAMFAPTMWSWTKYLNKNGQNYKMQYSNTGELRAVYNTALQGTLRGQATSAEQDSDGKVIKTTYSKATNIENSTNTGGLNQKFDGDSTFDFTDKNPNATELDSTLTGNITKGAIGNYASSFGGKSSAMGKRSHAEGTTTIAKGAYSHAEGDNSVALGDDSHAEGYQTVAKGTMSHSEGNNTIAKGNNSHSEGSKSISSGLNSHSEGVETEALGNGSHSEGNSSKSSNNFSHAEGDHTNASGISSHAEGIYTIASGDGSHAEGQNTSATGGDSHSEGIKTTASGDYSHAEGQKTTANGTNSHAEGQNTIADGGGSHAEGYATQALSQGDHSEGNNTLANGPFSHAEGLGTKATVEGAHSEGHATKAQGYGAHAEGYLTIVSSAYSHAEGEGTKTMNLGSHAEGGSTVTKGKGSHAEGYVTIAEGDYSHAEGNQTQAVGKWSHTEGTETIASSDFQHVQGKLNIADTDSKYAHIIGNGVYVGEEKQRSNAYTLDWAGNAWFAGGIKIGGTGQDDGTAQAIATEDYVNKKGLNSISVPISTIVNCGYTSEDNPAFLGNIAAIFTEKMMIFWKSGMVTFSTELKPDGVWRWIKNPLTIDYTTPITTGRLKLDDNYNLYAYDTSLNNGATDAELIFLNNNQHPISFIDKNCFTYSFKEPTIFNSNNCIYYEEIADNTNTYITIDCTSKIKGTVTAFVVYNNQIKQKLSLSGTANKDNYKIIQNYSYNQSSIYVNKNNPIYIYIFADITKDNTMDAIEPTWSDICIYGHGDLLEDKSNYNSDYDSLFNA